MKNLYVILLILFFAFTVFAQKQAQVMVTFTYIHKEPDSTAERIQTVQKGDKVTLEKKQNNKVWYYVSTANGDVRGWIRKSTISFTEDTKSLAEGKKIEIQRPRRVASTPNPNPTPKTTSTSKPVSTPKPTSTPKTVSSTKPKVNPTPSPKPIPPEDEEEVIRIDSDEINLNVRVIGANNRPVKNLNQSHFKVYEDGVLQTISSITTTEIPIINALVIDNSRSLRSQLKNIIEAGKIMIGTNRVADESAIIRFVSADKIEIMQDFTPSKSFLNNGLDNLFVEGGQTAIIDAVYLAAKKIDQYKNSSKEDEKLRALILISDGDDRSSSHTEEQLFELLRKFQVQIYAIGLVNNLSNETDVDGINHQNKAKSFLIRLTQESGGKVYFPDSIDELPQIASDISAEMHTQYLISYIPTNENRDGTFRKISVVISDGASKEKRIAITRTGRIAATK